MAEEMVEPEWDTLSDWQSDVDNVDSIAHMGTETVVANPDLDHHITIDPGLIWSEMEYCESREQIIRNNTIHAQKRTVEWYNQHHSIQIFKRRGHCQH